MNHTKKRLIGLLILAILVVLTIPATATALITASGDVDPADPNTWTSSITAYIGYIPENDLYDGFGSVTVNGGGDLLSYEGYLGYHSDSTGTVTVENAGSNWSNNGKLYIGYGGNGTLEIADGGTVSNTYSYIGYNSGSTSTVTVDGTDSTWTNNGSICVGYHGNGALEITNSGTVSSNGGGMGAFVNSTGKVTVDGAGSTWTNNGSLGVGDKGDGTLVIANGGAVSVAKTTWVGYGDDSTLGAIQFGGNGGTLTTSAIYFSPSQLSGTGTINTKSIVSDADIVLDGGVSVSQFTVDIASQDGGQVTMNLDMSDRVDFLGAGYKGSGSLTIQNGAKVYSVYGYIGYEYGSTGEATVDGIGSTWTNGDYYLYVGGSGDGTLAITNGGTVNSVYCRIGNGSASTSAMTVDGPGSTCTTVGEVSVGIFGDSVMTITNGGAVSNSWGCIGYGDWSTSTVTVDGTDSTWTNRDKLYVGYYGNGTLTIIDGGLVSVAGVLTVNYDGEGDSFISMSTGGMLALYGDADDSLDDFLGLIEGTDAIQYWDGDSWEALIGAVEGEDYTLAYIEDGELAGYTVLTVGTVPEPSVVVLMSTAMVGFLIFRRRKSR